MSAPLVYLPRTGSTNAWAKANPGAAAGVWGVYTLDQTAGRGRLGRAWAGAAGQALYYTAVLPHAPAQLPALGLLAGLLARRALLARYALPESALCLKWPNDLLLGGKKLAGILCEGVPGRAATVCGIGVNLAQPQAFFDAAGLPYATSLALHGIPAAPAREAGPLAQALTDAFAADAPRLCREGFAPWRAEYEAACANLGRAVRWDGGTGTALGVDDAGRLRVRSDAGPTLALLAGEVSLHGVYGAL